jgi:hypothetical protein
MCKVDTSQKVAFAAHFIFYAAPKYKHDPLQGPFDVYHGDSERQRTGRECSLEHWIGW